MKSLLLATAFALSLSGAAFAQDTAPDVLTITPDASVTCTESAANVLAANPGAKLGSQAEARAALAIFIAKLGEPPFAHDNVTAVASLKFDGRGYVLTFINNDCTGFQATLSKVADPAFYAAVIKALGVSE